MSLLEGPSPLVMVEVMVIVVVVFALRTSVQMSTILVLLGMHQPMEARHGFFGWVLIGVVSHD